jgi:hypothetical protein
MIRMKLSEALGRARSNSDVQILEKSGYFLGSIFSMTDSSQEISEWTFLYFNPQTNKIRDLAISEKESKLDEEREPRSPVSLLNPNALKISVNDAIGIGLAKLAKSSAKILVTLHQKDCLMWTLTFVSSDLQATTFDIDAQTGEILREETTSLIRTM